MKGSTTCSVKLERPGDYHCPHPCRRLMQCGHPCMLVCSKRCDEGLDSCQVCAVEREHANAERLSTIRQQIEALKTEDFFHKAKASEPQFFEVEHDLRSYFTGVGARAKLLSLQSVRSASLRRRFLLASQRCYAPQENTTFVILAGSEAEADQWAHAGLVAPAGGSITLMRTAETADTTGEPERCWFVVCRVQLGREYFCGHPGRVAKDWPPEGFDCTYDPATQCYRVFATARILPEFIAGVEVRPEPSGLAAPGHWDPGDPPSQGWRCARLRPGDAAFRGLAACLRTDPGELGVGRDVVEGGRYTRLELKCAWRIENPRLWRRYATERSGVREEILERRIKLPDPSIRKDLKRALADLPDPLHADVNEVRLLHGTRPDTVLILLSNGPNERFSGGLFGCGTYLAEDAGKNDQYVTCDRSTGQRGLKELHCRLYTKDNVHPGNVYYLFLCRTVLGRFVPTKSGADGATPTDGSGSKVFANSQRRELGYISDLSPPVHYHALLAELGGQIARFREFVQFRDARIYPEYLLAYQRKA